MAKDAGGWRREVASHVVNLDTSRAPLSALALGTLITELAEKNWLCSKPMCIHAFVFVFFNVFNQNWNYSTEESCWNE